jgi:UPF0716 protein FxsA
MGLVFAVGFVALVVGEIYVLIAVAEATSPLIAVLLLLGTSVVGGALVRREGAKAWGRATRAVQEGRPPGKDVADGALILIGGALLLIPGFITDVVGLLVVLPLTRRLFRGLLHLALVRRVTKRFAGLHPGNPRRRRSTHSVIDGEVVNHQTSSTQARGGDTEEP